jgi:hypothetical protein
MKEATFKLLPTKIARFLRKIGVFPLVLFLLCKARILCVKKRHSAVHHTLISIRLC